MLLLIICGLLVGNAMINMPGRSYAGALLPLSVEQATSRDALHAHVRVLSVEIGERNLRRYDNLKAAAAYIERTLRDAGYPDVTSQTYTVNGHEVRNLSVEIRGTARPDGILVVGAHYDSCNNCPAANDNGTGVAAALLLARQFLSTKPACTLRFVFFVNEEPPYFQTEQMGSLVYARACKARDETIVGMISLETIGYFSDAPGSQQYPAPLGALYPDTGNFIGFAGNVSSRAFVYEVIGSFRNHAKFPSEGAALPESLPGVGWSDHWSFSQCGYPALMVTDTAPFRYPHYHTPQDTIDKIDFDRMTRVTSGIEATLNQLVGISAEHR